MMVIWEFWREYSTLPWHTHRFKMWVLKRRIDVSSLNFIGQELTDLILNSLSWNNTSSFVWQSKKDFLEQVNMSRNNLRAALVSSIFFLLDLCQERTMCCTVSDCNFPWTFYCRKLALGFTNRLSRGWQLLTWTWEGVVHSKTLHFLDSSSS